ncbi:MAG: pyridoxine 5'-phosphate synthase [Bacteroidales bacterium]|nr:pyridoxine 5'-phosphate synthase [Bacteroidales bacterium]
MTKLSVNVNKIATLRNARGGHLPDLVQVVKDCERFGSQGITVHPRPDERHIRYQDVFDIKDIVTTEFNIEGYPSEKFINLVLNIKPAQVTLVPDPPDAITSNKGWDVKTHALFLKDIITEFKNENIRTSIFLDPNPELVKYAAKTGADRIELYTESYARKYLLDKEEAILPYKETAKQAKLFNMGLNAGHDLNLDNLAFMVKNIDNLLEVSIGHALICDALYFGLENTIQMYLREIHKGLKDSV